MQCVAVKLTAIAGECYQHGQDRRNHLDCDSPSLSSSSNSLILRRYHSENVDPILVKKILAELKGFHSTLKCIILIPIVCGSARLQHNGRKGEADRFTFPYFDAKAHIWASV